MTSDYWTWIDEEVAFYDFIWMYGVNAHGSCINKELAEDFQNEGRQFEEMKKMIFKKFPSREEAWRAFKKSQGGK